MEKKKKYKTNKQHLHLPFISEIIWVHVNIDNGIPLTPRFFSKNASSDYYPVVQWLIVLGYEW